MVDLINWYLAELRFRLEKAFSGERLDVILKEAESHLRESAQRIYESGRMSEESATKVALRAYGTPERVAMTYLSRSNPKLFGLDPIWTVLAGGLAAIACWDFQWLSLRGFFDNFGETWENGVAGFVGFVALTLLAVGCARGFRRYRVPLLSLGLGTALFLVPLLSFWIVGATKYRQGLSRLHLARDVARARQVVAKLEAYKGYYVRGATAFSIARSPADLPPDFASGEVAAKELGLPRGELLSRDQDWDPRQSARGFVMPYEGGVMALVDGRIWGIETTSDFAKAKEAWRDRAGRDVLWAAVQEQEFQKLLASADQARSGTLFFFNPAVYSDAVVRTLIFTPGLLIVEWLVFAASRRRRYWPGRAIA